MTTFDPVAHNRAMVAQLNAIATEFSGRVIDIVNGEIIMRGSGSAEVLTFAESLGWDVEALCYTTNEISVRVRA